MYTKICRQSPGEICDDDFHWKTFSMIQVNDVIIRFDVTFITKECSRNKYVVD